MKGNAIRTMLILAVIISVVIVGSLGFVGNLSTEYGKTPDTEGLNRSIEIQEELEQAYELFENEENVQSNWLGDTIVTGGKIVWSFITLTIKVPGLLGDLIHELGVYVGIPPIFLAGASALILIIGMYALLEILTSG